MLVYGSFCIILIERSSLSEQNPLWGSFCSYFNIFIQRRLHHCMWTHCNRGPRTKWISKQHAVLHPPSRHWHHFTVRYRVGTFIGWISKCRKKFDPENPRKQNIHRKTVYRKHEQVFLFRLHKNTNTNKGPILCSFKKIKTSVSIRVTFTTQWNHKGQRHLSQVRDNNQPNVQSSSKHAAGPIENKQRSKTHHVGGGCKQKAKFLPHFAGWKTKTFKYCKIWDL